VLQINAQDIQKNNIQKPVEECIESYFRQAGDYSTLFTGKDQAKLEFNLKTPYLQEKGYIEEWIFDENTGITNSTRTDRYTKGKLSYDGVLYNNIPMRLDLYKDEIIVTNSDNTYNIVLDSYKVEMADLLGYRVVYMRPDGANNKMPEGYYMKLYEGDHTALKRESFKMFRKSNETYLHGDIKYYIEKDGVYHTVKSKGSVLNVFKIRKKELDKYIKENKLGFDNVNLENTIVAVIQQYEKLENND